MPSLPRIMPPVGKSGPLTKVINSSSPISLRRSQLSMTKATALATSVRLWGGTLVAIPTAMPLVPLTRKLSSMPAAAVGSSRLSSKLGPQSTVSMSMSASIASAMREKAGLRVTHGGGAVAVHRAEVTLAVDQGIAQAKVLRHARHGVVDGCVAVGMILAEHFTDDTGALLVGGGRAGPCRA